MEDVQFLKQVEFLVHGTTQGTNIIITRSGSKVGVIATEGHKDVLQLRRVIKENIWNWRLPCPEPLSPPYLWVGVKERLGPRGEIKTALDEDSVHKAVAYFRKLKVESIVVALLFSFVNPEHERKVAEIVRKDYPEAYITLSSEIAPVLGEYERTSTAVISAYIAPPMAKYIRKLEDFLEKHSFGGQFLFMQNNGGVEASAIAIEKPATLAMSGPAAGPTSALTAAKADGAKNIVSVDMGGTSFDCALIDKGSLIVRNESLIDDHRFSLPVIDAESIGAGGGSIAWFDISGTLRVGPKSAGGDPGPACYGRGGEEATVTDADVILGYISPDYFLGGEMKLTKNLAEKAVKERVADRLGMSIEEAAASIYKISNAVMADEISHVFTKRGYDPRDFAICAGGAASPVCILQIARDLNVSKVFIPKFAPIYCAFGMLGVDLVHDFSRFYHATRETIDLEYLKKLYKEMEAESLKLLKREGIPEKERRFVRTMEVKYYGQFRTVSVRWPNGPITEATVAEAVTKFHRRHEELRGQSDVNYPVEFLAFGLTAIGKVPPIKLKKIERGNEDPSSALKGHRDAYFESSKGFVKTKIYDGDKLLAGNILEGPCIVEERMTNVVIPPTFKLAVDDYGGYFGTIKR
jgi:N-methylhydantoinase A